VKTEVIRIAQRRCEERASQISAAGNAGPAATGRSQCGRCEMQNNKDASRTMTNYSFHDSCGRCRGRDAFKHSAGRSQGNHHWERRGFQAEIGRGRSPSICWYWERTEHAWDRLPWHSLPATIS
jgi:hypothetical protein